MPTPWDPRPAPPAPVWKNYAQQAFHALNSIQAASLAAEAKIQIGYDAQREMSQTIGPEAARAQVEKYADQMRAEQKIQGLVAPYRITVQNWTLSGSYFETHPDVPVNFPPMPVDLLLYLDTIEAAL